MQSERLTYWQGFVGKRVNRIIVIVDITFTSIDIRLYPEKEACRMQISSRFTIAIHMLVCMDAFKDEHKITSEVQRMVISSWMGVK